MSAGKPRTVKVDVLARVEGEGALQVKVRNNTVTEATLRIYEPPRFFEAFLRGRSFCEAPDITARICGICPVAYQVSAVQAMEDAFGVTVDGQLRALRRLLYCGEWIESHVLHVYLLHAPDFLGYESGIHMARDHAAIVTAGLQMKKIGNELVALVGGREIHPVNVRVGGFYRVPERRELLGMRDKLYAARDIALQTVTWVAGFRFPEFEQPYDFVALRHPDEYAVVSGQIVSSSGLRIEAGGYEAAFTEEHLPHSNALHSVMNGRGPYLVGPLARYSLNHDRLGEPARHAAHSAGLEPTCRNPFKSIVVRAVETVQAIDDALAIIEGYERSDSPCVPVEPREGTGCGVSEAPRGLLYHRYRLSADGTIRDSRIVPPTAQNQKTMEGDLRAFVERNLALDDRALTWHCEQAIRNYDPCISCATHFLRLTVDRQ